MNPLQNLVQSLLTLEGALVDPVDPDGLEVLAPETLRQALGLPEWFRLGFGSVLPEGAQRVTLESTWMDHLGDLLGPGGRWLTRVAPKSRATPGDPERILQHGLTLLNATYRLQNVRPAWTRYLVFTCRYTALSDEKREGLVHLGVNTANGATLDEFVDPLLDRLGEPGTPSSLPVDPDLPEPWARGAALTLLDRALSPRVNTALQPFLSSMARRQGRDLERLFGYHEDLRREALARLARLPPAAQRSERHHGTAKREQQRLEAVAREYRSKVEDLRQKYAMRVTLEWTQTLELIAPVHRLEILLKRRKEQRLFSLDWNPLVRKLDHPPCEFSYTPDRSRVVCDEALHLVSPAAHGPCPGCSKHYCRACHPLSCPKCNASGAVKNRPITTA